MALDLLPSTSPGPVSGQLASLRDGDTRVLCNVDVASEGFDEPRVECVLLLRVRRGDAFWATFI